MAHRLLTHFKRFGAISALLLGAIPGHAVASGKDTGILMVHYGTTNDDMRARSLEAINADVKSAFPTHEFIEAYTSPAVITALEKKGLSYPTLTEALMTLRGKGITDVVVQSTMLMNGGQTDFVNRECERMRVFYNEMNVGRPLLYTIEDSRFLANALSRKYAGKASGRHDAVVFVGHGGDNPGTAIYSQLGNMLSETQGNFFVSTIEGYPGIDNLTTALKHSKAKNVTLVPLLIVGGNHIRKDIEGIWRERLEKEGFHVDTETTSLGELPEIRQWIVKKIASSGD